MRVISFALFLGLVASPLHSSPTTVCKPRDQMVQILENDYRATRQATGLIRPVSVMEVWVSDETKDWLIVTTDLRGSTCVVAHGDSFSPAPAMPVPDPPARAATD